MAELIGQFPADIEQQIKDAMAAFPEMGRQEVINYFGFGKEAPPAPAAAPAPVAVPEPAPVRPVPSIPIPRPFGGGSFIGQRRAQTEQAQESLAERRAREKREAAEAARQGQR